jgi:hypothetical protein
MNKASKEFDMERIKIYMSQSTEKKLRYLDEANAFFERTKDEKAKKMSIKLKKKGF